MLFLKGPTKTWYPTFDKMADECCALTANVPANLQICRTQPEPWSEGSGSSHWWVRFELYICFLHASSSSVLPKMWVRVRFVRFWFGSIPISSIYLCKLIDLVVITMMVTIKTMTTVADMCFSFQYLSRVYCRAALRQNSAAPSTPHDIPYRALFRQPNGPWSSTTTFSEQIHFDTDN